MVANAQAYTFTDLGQLQNKPLTVARGINDAGQVVGYDDSVTTSQAIFWNGTTPTYLSTPTGLGSQAVAINNLGQFVGNIGVGNGVTGQAVIWNGITPTVLGATPGDTNSGALAITQQSRI